MSPSSHRDRLFDRLIYTIFLFACVVSAKDDSPSGYVYGQEVPISCLSRSVETGEHITDETGNLHYIPFPTCNETSSPLSFRYGISETRTCTIDALSDPLYHIFEYYVHSDVPLACRMPTLPLRNRADDTALVGTGPGAGSPFTPLSIALQGTLQLSHLHIWTDVSVLLHRVPVAGEENQREKKEKEKKDKEKDKKKTKKEKEKKKKKDAKKAKKLPGRIFAGAAYSIPSVYGEEGEEGGEERTEMELPRDLWAAGQGTKVVRGEPLTFTFRVAWVQGEDVLAAENSVGGAAGGVASGMFMCLVAAGVGAAGALWWDKWYRKRRGGAGWNGDGLLGRSSAGRITLGNPLGFGSRGKTNGYGGYNAAVGNGYGGYSSGKRD